MLQEKKRSFWTIYLVTGTLLFLVQSLFSQVGISVSPPRLYYNLNPGETSSQKIYISNISQEQPLSLSITFGDWKYDEKGNNMMFPPDSLDNSCARWMMLPGGTYLSLAPGESREIDLNMTVPVEDVKGEVQTAMLYVTQMNPIDGVDSQGAVIKINVRQGVKIYRRGTVPEIRKLEIENLGLDRQSRSMLLDFTNRGNIWINGRVSGSLFNQATGKEVNIVPLDFYTLPGDKRNLRIPFQHSMEKGDYIATVMLDYGDKTTIEAAELVFSYE
ncbi:MAG: molecular chaperone [Tissierellia bacterium]|nr:molecular chaperone [Tissierellia bacterium]